jgi:cobalt ECF transporter T component CbiQ
MGLGLFFAMAVGLAAASRIGVGGFLKRVWLTVPVVVGVIALPATLNVVTRGTPVLVLTQSPFVAVTREGLWVAGTLAARVGVALSFAVLLTLTTPWHELLRALRSLLVPRVFVLVLSTTYRYLELVLRSAREMLIARRSRTVGPGTSREARRYVGGAFGALFGRSMRLADEVQAAMVSRGFSGDVRTVAQPRLRLADFLLAGGLALVALVAIGIERLS